MARKTLDDVDDDDDDDDAVCMLAYNLMVLVFVIFETMLRLIGVVCQVPAHQ